MNNGGEGRSWGWDIAEMAKNAIFSCYKVSGQKKMKKNSMVDVIFIGSNVGRTTTVIHGHKE